MTPRRKSSLRARLKQVQKELSLVNEDLRAISAASAGADVSGELPKLRSIKQDRPHRSGGNKDAAEARRLRDVSQILGAKDHGSTQEARQRARAEHDRLVRELGRNTEDARFSSYLAGNLQGARPLRHERNVQRNKAIVMLTIAVLALIWIIFRFFR
jgi:hypothetical protein